MDPGSPGITLSPCLVAGKKERFRDIGGMIGHWEEMERRDGEEEDTTKKEGGGRNRSSGKVKEMIGIYEVGVRGAQRLDSNLGLSLEKCLDEESRSKCITEAVTILESSLNSSNFIFPRNTTAENGNVTKLRNLDEATEFGGIGGLLKIATQQPGGSVRKITGLLKLESPGKKQRNWRLPG